MIDLVDVSKSYGPGLPAVNHANLHVDKGEFVFVVGSSGSGKSTMIKTLLGELAISSGRIEVAGKNLANMSRRELPYFRRRLGVVFQEFRLLDEMNVFENVELPLTYLGIKASERKERVLEILKRMNLSHRAKHFPQQLSGGQQQRVAIARAVVTNPKLILADEPTGNLDSKNGAEVMNLLTELNKEGTSIVMVTHSQHDAGFAHRVIHLFDGSVVANIKE